jgi:branched-chain amino acid transport system ATP-binding protein
VKLELKQVSAFHGNVQALREVDLVLDPGEVLCLLGRNGAGKTTLLRTIMGQVRHQGEILLDGQTIGELRPHEVPRRGIGYVPQGRRLFAELTVADNLEIGFLSGRQGAKARLKREVLTLFPVLEERLHQVSGTLSGGEQQMLAMARALCLSPGVLLLDEPTEGLMPSMIAGIREVVGTLRRRGVGILLVEQRVEAVLPVADRVAFIENGALQVVVERAALDQDSGLLKRYVGV